MILSRATRKVAILLTPTFLIFYSANSHADPSQLFAQSLQKSICQNQLNELLKKWGSLQQWIQRVPGEHGEAVFESPTERLGFWIQVVFPQDQVGNRKSPHAIQRSNGGDITVSWNETDCAPLLGVKLHEPQQEQVSASPHVEYFTDSTLELELKRNPTGIIYGWSPMMPLSVIGYNEAKSIAKKLKLAFIPVLDPMADLESAKTASTDYKIKEEIKKVGSVELLERGMNLHYPSILVFSQGKMAGSLLPGLWDSPQALEAAINGALHRKSASAVE